MPLSDDPWIAENSIIDPERHHALGVITVFWNHCERMFVYDFLFRLQVYLALWMDSCTRYGRHIDL
jgi:hypothetical protein